MLRPCTSLSGLAVKLAKKNPSDFTFWMTLGACTSRVWQHLTSEIGMNYRIRLKSEVHSWSKVPCTSTDVRGGMCVCVSLVIHRFVYTSVPPLVCQLLTWCDYASYFRLPNNTWMWESTRGVREDISSWVWSFPRIKNQSRLFKWEEFHDNPAPGPKHSCVSRFFIVHL